MIQRPFGSVVRDVYIEYYNELAPKCVLNIEYRAFDEIKNKLCENIKNFLERFYEVYKKEDTWDLVDATHRERPWVEAYKENAKEVIDRTTLRNFLKMKHFNYARRYKIIEIVVYFKNTKIRNQR